MKVGDYIRTINGISKIIKIQDIITSDNEYITTLITHDNGNCDISNILKSSPNIIDLIEIGDLVRIETEKDDTNIFEVVAINYNDGEIGVFNNNFEFDWASIEQLKSILTKEQFEEMKYKL